MSARFKIDSRGQLAPESSEAAAALGAKAGSFVLAHTAPDLVCMVRSPASGGQVAQPRVVLAGDAAGFPLSDLIAFLSQSRWTGVVRVHAPNGERTVGIKDGEVRSASSDDPADRLGEIMVRLGYIDRDRLEEVLRDTPPSKVGRALVERGMLQAHDLWKCLTHQVSEIFHAIVLSRDGAFLLLDQEPDERQGGNLQLSTQSLLMDSIRKIDELAHFRKRIPHGRLYVSRKRGSDGKLEEEEDLVLSQVNGERTVLELGLAAKLSEFDVTKAVFRLLELGYASLSDKPVAGHAPASTQQVTPVPVPPKPAVLPARAVSPQRVIQVFNSIFREIRAEVAKQKMDREFISAANAAIAGEALSSSPVLAGLLFDATGALPEARVQEQFDRCRPQLGSEPVASLKKALSDVMFFLLFQAGELLESRADEDLARRVKDLLATLDKE
ncbi:MAG TPA: DUF4388 domain-containing protein [Myxococcaceae bacterium]|nr:DUF4388 domain-containing protein [Myxococcaceae bacterium]